MALLDLTALIPNTIDRLVAVEPGIYGKAVLYRRLADATVAREEAVFPPWLLTSSTQLADALSAPHETIPLTGEGHYQARVVFEDYNGYSEALKELKKLTGVTPSSYHSPYRVFSDFTQQFLSLNSARLFGGMTFSELRRLQLDIETHTGEGRHFPDATQPEDVITLIGLRDSTGWETCLTLKDGDEAELLRELVRIVNERDPDVIEGHNIFNFDLPYIAARCQRHKVKLSLGRNGSEPKTRSSLLTFSERKITFTRFEIYGRHVVDTYHLVQLYDISRRDMESHGLKAAAKYFGVAAPNRTYVEGSQISETFDTDPERLQAYCLDDVRETDAISRILSPSFFYQASLVPLSYQNCVIRSTATRIDAMLCAEYMTRNAALPVPQDAVQFAGALTAGEKQGVFQNVWHVDVRSLYPSIIISRQLTPASDHQSVFLRLLTGLREFRLAAKDARKTAPPEQRDHYDALQSTFKILINSFYGYCGFAQGTFNDYRLAALITSTGRDILDGMSNFLESIGAMVIEMDTDGIYFTPPPDESSVEQMQNRIQQTLPPGIEIEIDDTYQAMLGYKSKNYALLHHDGRITMSGAALRSRGLEPFQRHYIADHVSLLLQGHAEQIPALYQKYVEDIENHRLPLSDFAKKEYLSSDPKTYLQKVIEGKAKRSASYELAVRAGGNRFQLGDAVTYYVTGDKKTVSVTDNAKLLENATPGERDENLPFYLNKLKQLYTKFSDGKL